MVECAFIDSKSDMDRYNANDLAKGIVEGVTGVKVDNINDKGVMYKVICGVFSKKENADGMVMGLKEKGIDAFVEKYIK